MRIAILGAGNVGRTLGAGLDAVGHEITSSGSLQPAMI